MKRFVCFVVIQTLLILGAWSMEFAQDCDYEQDTRTYLCHNIIDVFPNKFYGNYHIKCIDCKIRTFSNKTFPFTNSLVSFNVSESGIRYIARKAFSSLTNIQYIYLQNNQILEIAPGAFWGLRQVYEIHLENNEIVNIFPGFLEELQANSVDLSHNRIRELPNGGFVGALGILILDLSKNQIKKVNEDAFVGLENLEVLNLANNKICNLPLGLFRHFPTLRQLDLADNKLAKFGIGAFSGLKNLNILTLANNTISNFDASSLLPFNHLSKLDLAGNGIYYLDAQAVHSSVPTMRTIRIDENLFSCSVLEGIVKYFKNANVEIVNTVGHYNVQNINGIACTEMAITNTAAFSAFLEVAKEDTKKYNVMYC